MSGALRALLVGGAGFIGTRIAASLLADGHHVTVMTRGLRAIPVGCEGLVADRTSATAIAAALEGRRFDLTVDFQAMDAGDVERLLTVPYAALGRYVMISSGQVYLVAEGAVPPFREEEAERPVLPEPELSSPDHAEWRYGVGKRRAEQVLAALRGTHGMRAVALRLPIVQGEGDPSLRLWAYLERLLDGGPVLLPDGGVRRVRHVDVMDVARAVSWLAAHPAPRMMAYNLAPPESVTLRELLERMAHVAGVKPRFVEVPWSEMRAAGLDDACSPYGGRWSSEPDPSRVAAEWGFLGTRIDDWLPRVARWHLEHRPAASHPGYAQRARERELATRHADA
ncbi:MAG: NAD-dependent epimerase/dehydratase family protein [Candidatus Eisenbacteria bacterium]